VIRRAVIRVAPRRAAAVPLIVLALASGTLPAHAHTRSESHSAWQISGPSVRVQFTVPDLEVRRLAPRAGEAPDDATLARYLATHLGARSRGGACPSSAAPRAVATTPGYRRFEFQWRCPSADDLVLEENAFLDVVSTHTNFAQIRSSEGALIEQLFTQGRTSLDLGAASANRLENAGFLDYLRMGISHILTGVDHQAFLLGLVLISRRLRDLVLAVTGFSLGHSLTLALAVTGLIRPHAEYIDALVGLTIALIGAENIIVETHRPLPAALGIAGLLALMALGRALGLGGLPVSLLLGSALFGANYLMLSGQLPDAGRQRIAVTVVFGLIHGFGFASNLLEMRLPAGRVAELLTGFNLGVEIGQLGFVVLASLLMLLAARWRPSPVRGPAALVLASCLVGIGTYWFVRRSYG